MSYIFYVNVFFSIIYIYTYKLFHFVFQVGGNSTPLGLIGGLCVAPGNGELLVADTAIRVFSAKGDPIATYAQIPKGSLIILIL